MRMKVVVDHCSENRTLVGTVNISIVFLQDTKAYKMVQTTNMSWGFFAHVYLDGMGMTAVSNNYMWVRFGGNGAQECFSS